MVNANGSSHTANWQQSSLTYISQNLSTGSGITDSHDSLKNKLKRAGLSAMRIYAGMSKSSAKPMFPQYHPELIDPKHRYAKLLYPYFESWKNDKEIHSSFPEWLKKKEADDPKLLKIPCVTYLGEDERKSYELHVAPDGRAYSEKEGFLQNNEDALHPYIYVISPDEKMYIGRRDNGRFNHSSFMSGQPVVCAGELFVQNERVACITDTSGHYKTFARPEMLLNGVLAMHNLGLRAFHVVAQAKQKNERRYEDSTKFIQYHNLLQLHRLKKEYTPIVGMTRKFAEDEVKKTGSWIIWRDGNTAMVTHKTENGYIHEQPKGTTLAELKKVYGTELIKMEL